MIPGQQVTGKVGKNHGGKQRQADDPVELAGCGKSAGIKDPQKMKEGHEQKPVCTPPVDVSDQLTEWNMVVQIHDGVIRSAGKRLIYKLEHQTGAKKQKYQYCSHAAKPPGQG